VGLGVYPAIPNSSTISWLKDADALPDRSRKRLYPVLVSLQSVLDSVSPHSGWARRRHELLSTRSPMNLRGMGVPENWAGDEFWSRRISDSRSQWRPAPSRSPPPGADATAHVADVLAHPAAAVRTVAELAG